MKKRRIDLTVSEQISICNSTTACADCTINKLCWDDNGEAKAVSRYKDWTWLNEEIEIEEGNK